MSKFIEVWKKYTPEIVSQAKKLWNSEYIYLNLSDHNREPIGRLALEVSSKFRILSNS
jgi:hypothetical protein